MPDFELPDPESLTVGDLRIEVDVYSDRISAEWDAGIAYAEFVEATEELSETVDEVEVFFETSEGGQNVSLQEALASRHSLSPEFAAAYGPGYSLRWEAESDVHGIRGSSAGAAVKPHDLKTLLDVIRLTTDEEVPSEDRYSLRTAVANVE
jgi:hypothetical protein